MIKKYKEQFKLTILAGQASAIPPIGPMLGQRGINIMEFGKEFNNLTKQIKEDLPLPVLITINKNRTFHLNIKSPTNFSIFKKLTNILKGSSTAKQKIISTIKITYLYEILKNNNPNLTEKELLSNCKILIASAKSIGIHVIK